MSFFRGACVCLCVCRVEGIEGGMSAHPGAGDDKCNWIIMDYLAAWNCVREEKVTVGSKSPSFGWRRLGPRENGFIAASPTYRSHLASHNI